MSVRQAKKVGQPDFSIRLVAAGFFALLLGLAISGPFAGEARAEEMAFQVVSVGTRAQCGSNCPEVIAAEGEISDATPEAFRSFIASHAGAGTLHSIVLLNSYGGKVVAAMELGKIFRQIGAAVVIAQPGSQGQSGGRCFSACVYALIGGKKRVVPPESEVGVHRMVAYAAGEGFAASPTMRLDNGSVAAVLSRYCSSMGVNPAVIKLAEHTEPGRLYLLSRAEISRWRLAVPRL